MRKIQMAIMGKYAVPLTTQDYITLVKSGIRTTRVGRAFLPTLSHILRGAKVQEISWVKEVLKPKVDKTREFWENRDKCRFASNASSIVLTGVNTERNKKVLAKIESIWRLFFNRWGFHHDCTYTETGKRIKLVIVFKISSYSLPEIPVTEVIEDVSPAILEFPFVRFKLSLGERFVELTEETRIGGTWIPGKTHRSTYTELKSNRFIGALFDAMNHRDKLTTI